MNNERQKELLTSPVLSLVSLRGQVVMPPVLCVCVCVEVEGESKCNYLPVIMTHICTCSQAMDSKY